MCAPQYTESANSDGEIEDAAEDLDNDDEVAGQSSDVDPNDDDEDEDEDDEGEEDIDPNHEHLSTHTKSLIAHLASLPGFGQTRARVSYVPYTAHEPAGSTLAELQLPWRRSPSIGGGVLTEETALSSVSVLLYSASQCNATSPTQSATATDSTVKLRSASRPTSLVRKRGTNHMQLSIIMIYSAWACVPRKFVSCF